MIYSRLGDKYNVINFDYILIFFSYFKSFWSVGQLQNSVLARIILQFMSMNILLCVRAVGLFSASVQDKTGTCFYYKEKPKARNRWSAKVLVHTVNLRREGVLNDWCVNNNRNC